MPLVFYNIKYKANSNPPITENSKSRFLIGENTKYKDHNRSEKFSVSFLESIKKTKPLIPKLQWVGFIKIMGLCNGFHCYGSYLIFKSIVRE